MDSRFGAYTRLRFLMVFAVGAVLSAGFYAIGLNYWLLVGAFVGLIEIVPIIAPLIRLDPRPRRRPPALAVILAVPVTSAVATLIDVLVFGHELPTEQPRRSLRLRRSG